MDKKPITAYVTLLAFAAALAVPTLVSASPILTETKEPNVAAAVASTSKVIATNTGNILFTTSQGTVECTKAVLTGTVKKNAGTEIEVEVETVSFTGTGTEGRCTTSFLGNFKFTPKKLPWCIKAWFKFAADTFTIEGAKCGSTGSMEFTQDWTTIGECTYTKTRVEGSFTTGEPGTLSISEQEFKKSAGSAFCPGSAKLDMTLDLYTDSAGAEGPQIFVS